MSTGLPRIRRQSNGPRGRESSLPLNAPGTHNRKAKRAAKARAQLELPSAPLVDDATMRAYIRRNAKPFNQIEYDVAEGRAEVWPYWIPLQETVDIAVDAAQRFAPLTPEEFSAKGVELGEGMMCKHGEALSTDWGKMSKKALERRRAAVRALGEALGLGACVQGGIKFCGLWLEMVDGEVRIRMLLPEFDCEH
jgi:hypothetical protein